MSSDSSRRQRGFTIVELMIATTVLSVMLLMVSQILTSIGNLYYKGYNVARTQQTARNIANDIAQQIQYSNNPVMGGDTNIYTIGMPWGSATIKVLCVGSYRYSYITDHQIGTDTSVTGKQIPHVLWRDQNPSPSSCPTTAPYQLAMNSNSTISPSGTELMADGTRLTYLKITGTDPYSIEVGVAYGADDLLNVGGGLNTACHSGVGDQYCATATVTTAVVRRL